MTRRRTIQDSPPVVDLTVINVQSISSSETPGGFTNKIIEGRPRNLLNRVVRHIQQGHYSIVSLSIGGPIDYKSTCAVVISTNRSNTPIPPQGLDWDNLEDDAPHAGLFSVLPERSVQSDTRIVRLDFTNSAWRSSYNLIRGALHGASVEQALVCIDTYVRKGCFRLESLFAVQDWCSIGIDTDLTQQELKAKGFVWHGLVPGPGEPDDDVAEWGALVYPGHDQSGDYWQDDEGVKHYESLDGRDL